MIELVLFLKNINKFIKYKKMHRRVCLPHIKFKFSQCFELLNEVYLNGQNF